MEGHIEGILDELEIQQRIQSKHSQELLALTGTTCEMITSIRELLAARLESDSEKAKDQAIVWRLIWSAALIYAVFIGAQLLLAWLGVTRPVSLNLVPPYHSSELPREAGGKLPW